jgi:hypothetical protein
MTTIIIVIAMVVGVVPLLIVGFYLLRRKGSASDDVSVEKRVEMGYSRLANQNEVTRFSKLRALASEHLRSTKDAMRKFGKMKKGLDKTERTLQRTGNQASARLVKEASGVLQDAIRISDEKRAHMEEVLLGMNGERIRLPPIKRPRVTSETFIAPAV